MRKELNELALAFGKLDVAVSESIDNLWPIIGTPKVRDLEPERAARLKTELLLAIENCSNSLEDCLSRGGAVYFAAAGDDRLDGIAHRGFSSWLEFCIQTARNVLEEIDQNAGHHVDFQWWKREFALASSEITRALQNAPESGPADQKTDQGKKKKRIRPITAEGVACGKFVKAEMREDNSMSPKNAVEEFVAQRDGDGLAASTLDKQLQDNPQLWTEDNRTADQ